MNKKEFLEELEERLIGISKEDKEEILQDYEEHFKAGKKKKRTEEEISKSLGEPKEIAKDIRKELSGKKEGEELKTEAIESWVALKKFSRHIFNETKDKVNEISDKFNPKKVSHWIWATLGMILFFMIIAILGGGFFFLIIPIILIFLAIKIANKKNKKLNTKNKSKKNKEKHEEKSIAKIILILLFNIFIFVWVWISLFFVIIAFFISGIVIVISGIALSVFSIFSLINYSSPVLKNFFFSGLFAGFGVSILGILFIILFDKVIQVFFILTKKYLKLNSKFIKK